MAQIDVSLQRARLLEDQHILSHLPAELLQVIHNHASTNFLDAVAAAALIPTLTTRVFLHFESIFADVCARWTLRPRNYGQDDQIISSFARILPFAPHLAVFLDRYLRETSHVGSGGVAHCQINSLNSQQITQGSDEDLLQILTAFWRLLSFDAKAFGQLVRHSQIQPLFKHALPAVRFVAIRIFCVQLGASDYKIEQLIRTHIVEQDSLVAKYDGLQMDYTFFSLLEQERARNVDDFRAELNATRSSVSPETYPHQEPTNLVVRFGETLLPRPNGDPLSAPRMVHTSTTLDNLEVLAQSLQQPGPILLTGLPGSGKTSLVHEMARELDQESTLVTLHLNEQTDAKMLIGLYSTDSKPGTFSWRPGVLTTAVREGRWVLIEDLDRAPNEVMSTLLPLVERGKLLIPSRGETIEAPSSFRLFATVRTTRGSHGQESLPNLLGQRFWHVSSVKLPHDSELEHIITGEYPILHKYTPMIMSAYRRLSSTSLTRGGRSSTDRPITPRDLLKWCRRLKELLVASGCTTGEESISDTTKGWMFMDAVDCFCGSHPKPDVKTSLIQHIAEEMHLPQQLVDHYMEAQVPQIEETSNNLKVGRVMLARRKHANRIVKSKKPFAATSHARRVLEQIGVAVKLREPVLLVGETGIGKTTAIQQLAEMLGQKLVAVNLSQQSEVGDLLGGFKPVNVRSLAVPLKEEFEDLWDLTGISATKNQHYLELVGKNFAKGRWPKLSKLWHNAPTMFNQILREYQSKAQAATDGGDDGQPAVKRRKTGSKLQSLLDLQPRWDSFAKSLEQFDVQIAGGSGAFAFTFVEGNIVKAARNGDWVLLDEINLASPDTLESIADLLASGPNDEPSILLSETGEIERVKAHPDFRIFGAMNPATDIGKRDLPQELRSRFTELYVSSPDRDLKDLLTIIKAYLSGKSTKDDQAADDIARLYRNTKTRAEEKRLVDGANEVPHFSLRTLTRVLSYVNDIAPSYGLRRALFEGFSMGFLTLLDRASEEMLVPLIQHHLLERHGSSKSLLSQPPKHPNDGRQYVKFMNKNRDRQYWLLQGAETPMERSDYIITPYIERNLLNLVRATSTRRFPILIQGPTSAGKTSMIEYLANFSGNKFVRINNHEHTDLQEYLGTYVSDSAGKLRFQEGLLVQALRQGHWIVLDELNLAPTDVLEALNRLLDDNRELLIPETQEVVRPHENFMLFATQNPPGLYGGRKALSRAFRNRFLELHYDDIPEEELETILQKRSLYTAPSDCKRIVNVYKELSRLRQTSRLFENKDSFATLRDLFRWALRGAETREDIAANGFMLLAERVRDEEEGMAVKKAIEGVFKVKIDQNQLYDSRKSPQLAQIEATQNGQGVVWTHAMRRLYVLVSNALRHNEPVLLVGETGCGKTTVCQILAEALGKELHIVNAHQNTETGDLIGSQRPVRNRGAVADVLRQDVISALNSLGVDSSSDLDALLQAYHGLEPAALSQVPADLQQRISENEVKSKALFEWADGSLVHAMRNGQFFLLDEISLADDSVLERLNSVLEPGRSLLLAEKGVSDSFVNASDGFQFLSTMNPGGDFGKKELSPALRNRFTEIWVPPLSESEDVLEIVSSKLKEEFKCFSKVIVDFSYWFGKTFRGTASTAFSIRDILVWIKFINSGASEDGVKSVIHGASTVFIDTLGANPSALIAIDAKSLDRQRQTCLDKLSELLKSDATTVYRATLDLKIEPGELRIGDFSAQRAVNDNFEAGFALHAPTTKLNAMRVLRALRVEKPILLEGSPGVGKTTLVSALARACGQPLTRINLSDQTDLMDLFGTDVPVEGAEAGHFAWRDAPFLRAMQNGEWVLLDEMNLASQSVLEGLNACLDHRGEVYISELDQVFKRHPDFRLFAAQNPHHQGGGRKGLPSSFVNRFVVVFADVFTEEDLLLIAQHNFPAVPQDTVRNLIAFVSKLEERILVDRAFGSQGSPWEFNLRDTLRWLHLLTSSDPLLGTGEADDFLNIAIRQRFRSQRDRLEVNRLFSEVFEVSPREHQLNHNLGSLTFQVGLALLARSQLAHPLRFPGMETASRLPELESLIISIKHNIPCILVGSSGSGKSTLLEHTAALAGRSLVTFPMNADIDAMDLVGGFEQSDPLREVNALMRELEESLRSSTLETIPQNIPESVVDLLNTLGTLGEHADNSHLLAQVQAVRAQVSTDSPLASILSRAEDCLGRSTKIEDPRFEWLDGVIVHALQRGQWLVLDNANLCNASVLDRLNSLLEPDGFLIINEHCGPNGEPRIVKPHPDFRIFLTVDPRYGELSRAMRNRAIELYIEPHSETVPSWRQKMPEIESNLQRYDLLDTARLSDIEDQTMASRIANDSLSLTDLSLLPKHLASGKQRGLEIVQASDSQNEQIQIVHQKTEHVLSFLKSPMSVEIQKLIRKLYDSISFSGFPHLPDIQPIHPLQNAPMLPLLDAAFREGPFWLAACYELGLDIFKAQAALEEQRQKSNQVQVLRMNRLQRSYVADYVAAVSKDSTLGASKFMLGALQALESYIREHLSNSESWEERKRLLGIIMHSWWTTFNYLTSPTFDEALFQAHLGLVSQALSIQVSHATVSHSRELATHILDGLNECFVAGFKMTTGLSMESLWSTLRPLPIKDFQTLQRIQHTEMLASRFDSVKWTSRVPPQELSKITDSFVKVYKMIRLGEANVDEILEILDVEIRKMMEQQSADHAFNVPPFFAAGFESIRQTATVDIMRRETEMTPPIDEIVLLSDLSLVKQMRLQSASNASRSLQSLEYLLGGEDTKSFAWNSGFSMGMLSKLDEIDSADLKSLGSLEQEMPILAKQISALSEAIASDQMISLSQLLLRVMNQVVTPLSPALAGALTAATQSADFLNMISEIRQDDEGLHFDLQTVLSSLFPSGTDGINETIIKHLVSAFVYCLASQSNTQMRRVLLGNSWVQFATAMVMLYVPDKAFDPQLRPQLEIKSHDELLHNLQEQVLSLQQFAALHTRQDTSLRCKLVQEDVVALGERPASIQTVYRPEKSELSEVQRDFNLLLKTVLGANVGLVFTQESLGVEAASQELGLIQNNVGRIISHLSTGSRAYEDMTTPAANILRCLEIGLSLRRGAGQPADGTRASLLDLVPFLGGSSAKKIDKSLPCNNLEFLTYISARVAVEGKEALDGPVRELVFQSIQNFHDQWRLKLEADRKAEEQKNSTFRYRGGMDEEEAREEEAFQELFPSFDGENDETTATKPKISDARKLAIDLARVHKDIFLSSQDPVKNIKSLIKLVARRTAKDGEQKVEIGEADMLSATILSVDDRLQAFKSDNVSTTYNFYTDANLPEARKLVKLVDEIRARFRELQKVDEIGHMQPLADVVMACDKILELSHSDPLAKIITDVEKLHGFVYEWQFGGWASRVYAVLSLYNRLTDMLVSWRRLELKTWGQLFDTEAKKADDDANSWWFVAYQAIIAGPMALVQEGEDVGEHAKGLLKELETYFLGAPVGQFTGRMNLLKQLHKQAEILAIDYPPMSKISDGLQHFISYFSRFEGPVNDSIRTGRAPVEKQMKDVVLLASWKDTNIVALRESARKSHLKLFRIVRKFRDVLGQPMKPIIEKGIPDTEVNASLIVRSSLSRYNADQATLDLCQNNIPGWTDEYRRLANVHRTVEIMQKLGRVPEASIDAVVTIDNFLSDLSSSAQELRKQTPGTLTEENTPLVKHLKSRKRKLFAETLKESRQMGFKFNLATDVLSRQDALSTVLATSQPLSEVSRFDSLAMGYHFHRMLDLAPRFRDAVRSHSDDLTGAEVDRSVGLLEGILLVVLEQRQALAKSLKSTEQLSEQASRIRSIAIMKESDAITVHSGGAGEHDKVSASWLLQVITVGMHIVEVHAKLGGLDSREVSSTLSTWHEKFKLWSKSWNAMTKVPTGLASSSQLELEATAQGLFAEFQEDLHDLSQRRPDLAFVIRQIGNWSHIRETSNGNVTSSVHNVSDLVGCTKTLCDSILVAVEQHNKALAQLPTEVDEAGWLVQTSEQTTACIDALHVGKIEQHIAAVLEALKSINLEDSTISRLAVSVIRVVTPILDQYRDISTQAIDRLANVHQSTCKLGFTLSKMFTQLAGQGFCTPQEQSDETSGDAGQLESGTGLGEGEGAEDISKDVQPDEDLTELAQEKNQEPKEDMDDEEDAVDMADQELAADNESAQGEEEDDKGDKSGDEEEEDGEEMDEETGDVDDLDPTAVDEKIWDGENKDDAEKDQEGDQAKGQKKEDEQVATDQKADGKEGAPEEDGDQGDEAEESDQDDDQAMDEDVQQQLEDETNRQDQNVEEQEALELPDDMNIEGNEDDDMSSISDDNLDDLSDVDQEEKKEEDRVGDKDEDLGDDDDGETENVPANEEKDAEDGDENQNEDDAAIKEDEENPEGQDEKPDEEEQEQEPDKVEKPSVDDTNANQENAAPSDVKSGGQDQDANQTEDQDDSQNNAAERESGEMGDSAADQEQSSGQKGSISKSQEQPSQSEMDDQKDSSSSQPFKALGDALEKWHRQQRDIKEAQEKDNQESKPDGEQQESTVREFQHLQNDESAAEAQALGTANEDQTQQQIDDSMAIDDDNEPPNPQVMPEDETMEDANDADDTEKMDTSDEQPPANEPEQPEDSSRDEGRAGVSTRQGAYNREQTPPPNGAPAPEDDDDVEDEIHETSTQLSSTHLTEADTLRDFDESLQQWTTFQTKTNALSMSLTSQLRLILTPSQSTKLSGSYRTGKRLNIKRIIPYIASSYKRDKIWMRRAVPTKRSYQILLCVDDSKSMGESSCTAGSLALESLVMVSRALTMLEVGQIGVLGFGANTFMAHDFAEPFASHDAGAKVLQRFRFQQDHTDIQLLIRQTIDRFRVARQQNTSRGSEDLWQLALILSDGLTPSAAHDEIRVLLREAMEERIMIVFIIMDDNAPSSSSSSASGGAVKKPQSNSSSVLNLKKVQFLGNDQIKTEYYLDTFPFQYYLIVHNLEDLPGALAGLLRTWFAEVNS